MPKQADNDFVIEFKDFFLGAAPVAHLNSLTEIGRAGHYSVATNVDILVPGLLTQGPALANLTNGTQAGVVSELINFIMDKAVATDVTYGIGATKLFKISSTTVASGGTPSWPRTIADATDGESCIDLRGNLYYFFNKSSGGDIGKYDLSSTFDDDWCSSAVPTGGAALQKAPHPVAAKEDIMVFGNGRYLGVYIDATTTIDVDKLDFGTGNEVADVVFHANQWHIAVNAGVTGTNRTTSQIYLYDGAALASILSDETAVGVQRIGFLYIQNGITFVAYQDLSSSGGDKIGYIAGRQIKALRYFTGSLPTYEKKTLYKNTILFLSSGLIYSCGAVVEQLPIQISQLSDGGYATCGALAAPFGTPMVASTDGGTNFRLAKFSGYDVSCTYKSIVIPTVSGRHIGYIDRVVALTNVLGSGASCSLAIEYNQAVSTSASKTITTTGKTRHVFDMSVKGVIDFRITLDWSGGSASNPVSIRKIIVEGHYVEA